jgi:hypothetical protein
MYQSNDPQIDQTVTSDRPANDQLVTTNKNVIIKEHKEGENRTSTARAAAFAEFWRVYPKRVSKAAAEKAFRKLPNPTELLPVLLQAIAIQKETDQWHKDGGQFIPYPATWLNERRWEDDPKTLQCGHSLRNQPRPTTDQDHAKGF